MKKLIILILSLSLLTACTAPAAPTETAPTQPVTEIPITEPPTTETEPPQPVSISWARAFRSNSAPEGTLTEHEIAFRHLENGQMKITNISLDTLAEEMGKPMAFPRTHWYDQFMHEGTVSLLPAIDYALLHGETSFVIPSRIAEGGHVNADALLLGYLYRVNNDYGGFSGLTVTSTETEDGKLNWVLVKLPEIGSEQLKRYLEGLEEARQLVALVPEGSSQEETALFLYEYLTAHVRYDKGEYYESDWSLLYDALIRQKTVCAGFTEAMYALFNFAGIDCFTLWGWVGAIFGDSAHAWNAAQIDGEWYLFDATWDNGEHPEDYRFFGVSTETMNSYGERDTIENLKTYAPVFDKDLH